MSTKQISRLMSPEEIALRAGEQVPFLRLPEAASVFSERAQRLRQLAAAHPMRDFLLFVATIVEAQHARLQQARALALPDAARIDAAIDAGRPTLDVDTWPREAAWREELRALLSDAAGHLPEGPALEVVRRVAAADDDWIERQGERLLAGVMTGLDMAAAPLVAAGLQLHFTRLVIQTAAAHAGGRTEPFGRTPQATACPCCGMRPVASLTRIGAESAGFRYLACALCATQWHMVRIKCAHCESTKGISYRSLEPVEGHAVPATGAAAGAVQAECCAECGHYLKIVHMAKDPQVEPVADDLASLTLDLLVSEEGLERWGVNLMMLFGDAEDAPAPPGGRDAGPPADDAPGPWES